MRKIDILRQKIQHAKEAGMLALRERAEAALDYSVFVIEDQEKRLAALERVIGGGHG